MRQTGTVRLTQDDIATVVIKRQSACGENCANCSGCKEKLNEVTAENKIGAIAGDTVELEMSDKTVLAAAFSVYIVPLIIYFISFGVVFSVGAGETLSAIFALLPTVVYYVFLHFKDKKQSKKYIHKIIRIVS